MALANISGNTVYSDYINGYNQIISLLNRLYNGGVANLDSSITILNTAGSSNNVSLKLENGMYEGDGGLISNVRSEQLTSNTVSVTSNSGFITISGNFALGETVYINFPNVSSLVTDTSTANLATANVVNTVHRQVEIVEANAASGFATANAAFNKANSANINASAAFAAANTKQTSDADLTAIAALATTGLIQRTGSGTANTVSWATAAEANTGTDSGKVMSPLRVQQAIESSKEWVLIDSYSYAIDGTVASFEVTGLGNYQELQVRFNGVDCSTGTTDKAFGFRISADNGSSFKADSEYLDVFSGGLDSFGAISQGHNGNSIYGMFHFQNFNQALSTWCQGFYQNTDGTGQASGAMYRTTEAHNAIQFAWVSGDIDGGFIQVYAR